MEAEIVENDIARNRTTAYDDKARHPLTISDAVELFAQLGTPRSKRSVQRFCEQGHLDCVRIKGPRGDQFFINRESVERYAEELRQIEAVAALGDDARHDAPQHAVARYSAPERDTPIEAAAPAPQREPDEAEAVRRLKDENLNLRIDNRAKEFAIVELNRRLSEDRDKFIGAMQDMSYKLGAAETRLAQLEAPKERGDAARQTAPEPDPARVEAIIMPTPTPTNPESTPPTTRSRTATTRTAPLFFRADFRLGEGSAVIPTSSALRRCRC